MQWNKETDKISREEKNILDNQISNLCPYSENIYKINFYIKLSMTDGKARNILSIRKFVFRVSIQSALAKKYITNLCIN